jgi:uncharacterized protein (TIGR03086 family)
VQPVIGPADTARSRIPERLSTLGQAWQDESAWTGTTNVGGLELPGHVTGMSAGDEIVVHGWDLAVATGQAFTVEPDLLDAVLEFVRQLVAQSPEGTPGLFGPPVHAPDTAAPLPQLIALTGRDPGWAYSEDGPTA